MSSKISSKLFPLDFAQFVISHITALEIIASLSLTKSSTR